MCCIVTGNKFRFSRDYKYLALAAEKNPHGFGISYYKEGAWINHKSLTFKNLKKFLEEAENCPYIFHSRLATSGFKSVFNCHPFKLENGSVFAHNGILWSTDTKYSDTAQVANMCNKLQSSKLPDILSRLTNLYPGNRFVLGNSDGSLSFFGSWYKKKRATTYFSNLRPFPGEILQCESFTL